MNRYAVLTALALGIGCGLMAGCVRGNPNHPALAHVEAIAAGKNGAAQTAREKLAGADEVAVVSLALALKDEDLFKRAAACEALGATGNQSAARHLIKALADRFALVRRKADEALMTLSIKDMNFVAVDAPERRKEAIQRWKAWSKAR